MDLTNVTFIKVDIEESRIISFFRRKGPLYNVALPKSEYVFLKENGYKMTVRQYVLSDGSIVNADAVEAAPVKQEPVKVAAPAPKETVEETVEEPSAVEEEPAPVEEAAAEETTEEAAEEEKTEEPAPVSLPEDLCATIETTDDSIQVHTLTMEQYATYTKAELLKFVKALSASLPDEVLKQVETDRNISKRVLLEIIDTYVVADE